MTISEIWPGMYLSWIYSSKSCGIIFSLGVFVCPFGHRVRECTFSETYIFLLDVECQQMDVGASVTYTFVLDI